MELNSTAKWMDLPQHVRSAFQTKFGMPTLDRLPKGTVLYKFNHYRSLHGTTSKKLSPWWSPMESYKHDAGWAQKEKIAEANGVSIREWGRLTSAVKENWNSLNYLLVITTNVPVHGFFGGFAHQLRKDPGEATLMVDGEDKGKSKNLPGGATQFYIPNLHADHVEEWRVEDLGDR